ncbi:MAG: hypothetical protein IJ664_01885 [Clostridia bacterium]|nr:hypothetical protein [Clostridia bacterium]
MIYWEQRQMMHSEVVMLYAYQLCAQTNARYQDSLVSLSQKEMRCMLSACGVSAEVELRLLGGAPFLCFEAPALTPGQRAFLGGHSAVYMQCALEDGLLRPLPPAREPALPQDMPEILKYKGKTNPLFTQMLINLALSAGGQWNNPAPRVLDPICGHGTTLFCALGRDMDAIGVDSDKKSVQEGVAYAQKWLQYHRIKHSAQRSSLTLPGGRSAACVSLRVQERELKMILADTRDTAQLTRKAPVHALVADLPYGVQHAPRENGRMSDLESLLQDALPAWRQSLVPGCAAAIAFNRYTLRRDTLTRLAEQAGFILPEGPEYADFSHWVEQAIQRDVLVARRP